MRTLRRGSPSIRALSCSARGHPLEGETPIQLERRWVSPAIFPRLPEPGLHARHAAAHLLAAAPIEAGEQIVRAEAADVRTAGLLRLAEGAPVLTVARRNLEPRASPPPPA